MTACEHNSSAVYHEWGNVSLSLCTWECGSRLISVKDMNSGITKTVTVEAFAAQQTALEAARELADKMVQVYDTPEYKAVWGLWHSHNGQYKGGDWINEQEELEAALAALEAS